MSEWRPKHCECGGTILYEDDGQRVWSCCDRCSPVTQMKLPTDADDNRRTPHPIPETKKENDHG